MMLEYMFPGSIRPETSSLLRYVFVAILNMRHFACCVHALMNKQWTLIDWKLKQKHALANNLYDYYPSTLGLVFTSWLETLWCEVVFRLVLCNVVSTTCRHIIMRCFGTSARLHTLSLLWLLHVLVSHGVYECIWPITFTDWENAHCQR
jgi:hypothetical protein